GTWTLFHEDGKLAGVGAYAGDKKTGEWQLFWSSGEPWRRIKYVDDVEDDPGPRACARLGGEWVADAEKRALGCQVCRPAADDSPSPTAIGHVGYGRWTWWHPNGVVERSGELVAGERQGPWIFNYDNGAAMLSGEFANGKEAGVWSGS